MPSLRGKQHSKPPLPKNRKSCTECRRRKQRCSGTWPCLHCNRRNIARDCHFEFTDSPPNTAEEIEYQQSKFGKASKEEHPSEASSTIERASDVPDPKALGYLRGYEHFHLGELEDKISTKCMEQKPAISNRLQEAIRALPGRSLVDELVNHYLHNMNIIYCVIHPDTFLDDYTKWYEHRAQGRPLSPAFTCLLLQICVSAAQEPPESLQRRILYDLAEDNQSVAKRLHDAAEALSSSIPPGDGDIHQILRLLIAAATSKSEGRIVEAWHYVGAAVREEQECGIHDAAVFTRLSEMETEIRTRLWCYTVLWDWQMAEWLGRPMVLNVANHDLRIANLRLDSGPNGSPSPFVNTFEQYRLVHTLFRNFGRLDASINLNHALDIHQAIEAWALQLPPELWDPDLPSQWDAECPWLPIQRAQLHSFAEMVRFTPLKRHLLPSPKDSGCKTKHARDLASKTAINCVHAAILLFGRITLPRSKFHFVIFALADTSAVICSALLHDVEICLPRRSELLQAVQSASRALQAVGRENQSALNASKLVKSLMSKLRLQESERPALQTTSTSKKGLASCSNGTKEEFESGSSSTEPIFPTEHDTSDSSLYADSLDMALPDLDDLLNQRYTFEDLLGINLNEAVAV